MPCVTLDQRHRVAQRADSLEITLIDLTNEPTPDSQHDDHGVATNVDHGVATNLDHDDGVLDLATHVPRSTIKTTNRNT